MRVRIEAAMLYVGGEPFWRSAEVDMPDEMAARILAADQKMGRKTITVIDDPEPEGLSINAATRDQLIALPGVGEGRADKIIALRPFRRLDDVTAVSGIGAATIRRWQGVRV
jgi:DNA uptake protein ComE-like DNA-binding protein